jgi:hypothetical protein
MGALAAEAHVMPLSTFDVSSPEVSLVLGVRVTNAFVEDMNDAWLRGGPFRLLPLAPSAAHRGTPSFLIGLDFGSVPTTPKERAEAAHVLEAGLTVQTMCWHTAQIELALATISRRTFARKRAMLEESLVRQLGHRNPSLRDPHIARLVLSNCAWISLQRWQELLPNAVVAARRTELARAWSYLFESVRGLRFDRCDWEQLAPRDGHWDEFAPVGTKESAYLNAWKAVEAIIGDPGSARRAKTKIVERLRSIGANPEEEVGFHERIPLADALTRYLDDRDDSAGHGSGARKRDLALAQIVSLQAAARYVSLYAASAWRAA